MVCKEPWGKQRNTQKNDFFPFVNWFLVSAEDSYRVCWSGGFFSTKFEQVPISIFSWSSI
jgi:hypothetical protein